MRLDFWTKLGYSEYSDDTQSLHRFQSKEKSNLKVSFHERKNPVLNGQTIRNSHIEI